MRANSAIICNLALAFVLVLFAACGGEETADTTDTSVDGAGVGDTAEAAPTPTTTADLQKVNINTATEEEMLAIPNVGDRMVHEFEEYRPYVSIRQFRREIGKYVDDEQVAAYEDYIFVPVSPNESDEETLMQLPGVNEEVASELVAARPFESNDAFLSSLAEHVSQSELQEAQRFLASP